MMWHPPYRFPAWLAPLVRGTVRRLPAKDKTLYFTFDDGPDPEATPFVLDVLARYHARATFFLIGDRMAHQPHLLQEMVAQGHRLANHTFHHNDAWKTPCPAYLRSIRRTQDLIRSYQPDAPSLFRPPYGRITPHCLRHIRPGYHVILWSYLSLDYDKRIDPEKSFRVLKKRLAPGHIVVFHDSRKAFPSLQYLLPRLMEDFTRRGFEFLPLF